MRGPATSRTAHGGPKGNRGGAADPAYFNGQRPRTPAMVGHDRRHERERAEARPDPRDAPAPAGRGRHSRPQLWGDADRLCERPRGSPPRRPPEPEAGDPRPQRHVGRAGHDRRAPAAALDAGLASVNRYTEP